MGSWGRGRPSLLRLTAEEGPLIPRAGEGAELMSVEGAAAAAGGRRGAGAGSTASCASGGMLAMVGEEELARGGWAGREDNESEEDVMYVSIVAYTAAKRQEGAPRGLGGGLPALVSLSCSKVDRVSLQMARWRG